MFAPSPGMNSPSSLSVSMCSNVSEISSSSSPSQSSSSSESEAGKEAGEKGDQSSTISKTPIEITYLLCRLILNSPVSDILSKHPTPFLVIPEIALLQNKVSRVTGGRRPEVNILTTIQIGKRCSGGSLCCQARFTGIWDGWKRRREGFPVNDAWEQIFAESARIEAEEHGIFNHKPIWNRSVRNWIRWPEFAPAEGEERSGSRSPEN
ncbi:hypothetical protein LXL04_039504 [Taraxacum kok-saghyz]